MTRARQGKKPFRDVHVAFPSLHPTHQRSRTRFTHPRYLCGMLRCAAEKGLQDRIRGGAYPFLVMHAQQGGKRRRYCPERTNTHVSGRAMHRSRRTAAGSSPLKDLPDKQEADGDGYGDPQVRQFGVNFAIAVGQVGPAVAFGEPDPVCPHSLAEVRQHSKTEN